LFLGKVGLSEKAEISYEKQLNFRQKVQEIVHKKILQNEAFLRHFLPFSARNLAVKMVQKFD